MTSDSGGAAFNPMVRTEDNAPEPDGDGAVHDNTDEADDGQVNGEDQG